MYINKKALKINKRRFIYIKLLPQIKQLINKHFFIFKQADCLKQRTIYSKEKQNLFN